MDAHSRTPRMSSRSQSRASFSCSECGHIALKWVGRCPECQSWGSLAETAAPPPALRRTAAAGVSAAAQRLADVPIDITRARPSGIDELDRVLGGGLVPGAVVLLAGEPGVGKSTLLLAAASSWAARGYGKVLIVSGEETAGQVRMRAERLGALHDDVYLAAENDLGAVLTHIVEVDPQLLIVDSVQTISDAAIEGTIGGVSQVKAVAAALTATAKTRGMSCFLVGHVTKDGAVAGPRVLEHLVDVVLHFEGDRSSLLRMVRGVKNRFGPADEVGCFTMTEGGIESVADPSGLFLSDRAGGIAGTCATITMQGRRALPVEIQTLVGPAAGGASRTVSGLDTARVSLVLAVAARWGGISLANSEVLAATVGGVRVTEPAIDLPLAMAAWSSARDIALPASLVAIGELGLSGELRPIPGIAQRLAEAARLGFTTAIVPRGEIGRIPEGLVVHQAGDLLDALRGLGAGVQGVVPLGS